jgi:isopentenyldiphosphate isomerase
MTEKGILVDRNDSVIFDFIYKKEFENSLTEYEFDHVFAGISDNLPIPEQTEVMFYQYVETIIAIDTEYKYALVCGAGLKYLWILSREKSIPDSIWKDYLNKA